MTLKYPAPLEIRSAWSAYRSEAIGPLSVIVPLLYQLPRRLLSVPAVLLQRGATKDAELLVLRHENAVLRRQITGQVR